jgi:chemotaxis protein CheZ
MLEAAGRTATVGQDVAALPQRLAVLRGRYPAADAGVVAEIVRAVLETMQGDLSARETGLLTEVEELAGTIAAARAEIAALQVDDITASHIPSATDELDAIVSHTAAATDIILEVCETLDRVGGGLQGDAATAMQDATTKIYEACSFQDITGQRITKVVATLKSIDAKVAQMLAAFGGRARGAPSPPVPNAAPEDYGQSLLHGPQLPTAAMDQTDIDKLLASFD